MARGLGEQAANDSTDADVARAEPSVAKGPGRLASGTVLNNIWEVRRLHASGGMGEVYEGLNTGTDEKVAIKVMRERFAADPKIGGLLRSEARKMTRIRHPAVVHYIVMATEPTLGVPYIVMDYIDGVGLDKVIGQIQPTQDELVALMRRLAEGLRAAHQQGVFHRDLSPDNILLPGRRMADAKIIDFGIAKDIDGGHTTIVGDSFAGKIGFAAPEQFGDFEREIGPWTDIYSLGLVMLSLAQGSTVNMGSTLVEAVDRRRAGPNLAGLPPALRSVFERMLAPNPVARFRTMDALIEALDPLAGGPQAGETLGVTAPRERDLATKKQSLIEAQSLVEAAQDRERQAAAAAALAGETYLKAANDLKQVTDLQVSPNVLRLTQQELDAAREAREAAERTHKAALEEAGAAARRLTQAQTEHDTVFLEVAGAAAALSLASETGPPAQSTLGAGVQSIVRGTGTTAPAATVLPAALDPRTIAPSTPAIQPKPGQTGGRRGWLVLAAAAILAAIVGAAVLARGYIFPPAPVPHVASAAPPVAAKPPPPAVVSASASPAIATATPVRPPVVIHTAPKPKRSHHSTASVADSNGWAAGTDQDYLEQHQQINETPAVQAEPYNNPRPHPNAGMTPNLGPQRFRPARPNFARPGGPIRRFGRPPPPVY